MTAQVHALPARPHVPPQDIEAEESVLGAMLLSPSAIDAVGDVLPDGKAFYRESHEKLFNTIRSLHVGGQAVDVILLAAELERLDLLDEIGGRARIHELAALVPATANAPHYAKRVLDCWKRRRVQRMAAEIGRAVDGGATGDESVEALERAVSNLRSELETGRTTVITSFQLAERFEALVKDPPDENAGVAVPFRRLRRLMPGRLHLLGGYTADGKTSCALQFATAAAEEGAHVAIVSLEMSADDLADRIVQQHGVPFRQVQTKRITKPHEPTYQRALANLARWRLDVIDDPNADAASLHRYQRLGRFDLLIFDHLHCVETGGKPGEHRVLVERQVRGLRRIAREFNIPVIALVQLRRHSGTDPFPRPTLADIRESGMIEAEAALVWFVWRHRENGQPSTATELITAKNRFGPIGKFDLVFNPAQARFEEPSS